MRILELSYSLASGGAEHFAVDLCNALTVGNEVVLLTSDDDRAISNRHYRSEVSREVRYVNLACKSGHSISALFRICKTVLRYRPDIVHFHTDLFAVLLAVLCFRKCAYVQTIHSLAGVYLKNPLLKPLYRYIYKRLVVPVTISKQCSVSYRNLYGLDNDVLIVNGRSRPGLTGDREKVREKLNAFSKGRPVFIHVARYGAPKNQKVLFDAFDRMSNVCLVVVGGGFPTAVMDAVDASKVMFTGALSNVADYLAVSDFFVLSSLYEGLPLALLEAMSYGVIPISTPAGGVCDVIRDGENGFLSKGFDADSLAEAMQRALNHPVSKQLVIDEYERYYSMKSCAVQYLELFKK
jgi:glycosyltransferase involved in cell wall biosynthesis